jgi:hypothetical protein
VARYLAKSFNFASFDYHLFAYLFVHNARGIVIKNMMAAMFAIMEVLGERLDNDLSNDRDEYNCAIVSKRILDALAQYESE